MTVIREISIPILMYHEVTEPDRIATLSKRIQRSYIVSRGNFDSQIRYLSNNGYRSISLNQLIGYIDGDQIDLPSKSVIITFDDGFRGNYEYALPVLQRYGMAATFFTIVNKMDKEYMLTWRQLKAMQDGRMSIQSHTMNHLLLSNLDWKRTREELSRSKEIIEQHTGEEVRFISLPNGDSNRYYESIAREVGYAGGCSSIFGYNTRRSNPFYLKRIAVKGHFSIRQFEDILNDKSLFTRCLRYKSLAKRGISRVISKHVYDKVYNSFYGVENE